MPLFPSLLQCATPSHTAELVWLFSLGFMDPDLWDANLLVLPVTALLVKSHEISEVRSLAPGGKGLSVIYFPMSLLPPRLNMTETIKAKSFVREYREPKWS